MAATTPITILVCDDEPSVRRYVSMLLRRQGYNVLEAENGKHAMAVAGVHNGTIHLLLSDVTMPELDGPSLAEQLRAVHPGVKVIFMSGESRRTEGYPFVRKPFLSGALITTVQDALVEPVKMGFPVS